MQPLIEAITALSALDAAGPAARTEPLAEAGGFARLMDRELGDVNANVAAAESAVRALANGERVELHDVMISLERARLSVQTFVQVRNKLVESYQDLMRMQM